MVSRAIFQEVQEGRGVDGEDYVYLDVRHLDPQVIETKIPDVTEFARIYLGVEPMTEPVPIQPTAHYGMGGIPTDVDGRVVVGEAEEAVPGLYAAGECACVSVHGANRLGTNSLLDIIVFGRRSGRHAADYAGQVGHAKVSADAAKPTDESLRGLLSSSGSVRMADVRVELQEAMTELAGVVRTEEGLRKVQAALGDLRERYGRAFVEDKGTVFNTELMEAWELGALLDCAETLVAAALARDESRGGHYRADHELRDDDSWLRHSLAYREDDGSVRLEYKPVKMGPYVPMERKY